MAKLSLHERKLQVRGARPEPDTNGKACGEPTSILSPEMESDKTNKKDYIRSTGKKLTFPRKATILK